MICLIFCEAGDLSQMPISHRAVNPHRAMRSSSAAAVFLAELVQPDVDCLGQKDDVGHPVPVGGKALGLLVAVIGSVSETGGRNGARPPTPHLFLLLENRKGGEDVFQQAGGQDAGPFLPDIAQLSTQGIRGGPKRCPEEFEQGSAKKAGEGFPGQFPVEFRQGIPVGTDPSQGGIVEELGDVSRTRVVSLNRQEEKLDQGAATVFRAVRPLQKFPDRVSPENGGGREEAGEVFHDGGERRRGNSVRTCHHLIHF
ncbi:MAG: hypothetical protein P8Z70_11385, partial [Desulfuromonadales bacterium]